MLVTGVVGFEDAVGEGLVVLVGFVVIVGVGVG